MQILHIVRRYGPVGGMERYVWELTQALARSGHRITVLCERLDSIVPHPELVDVHELGATLSRPRWFAHVVFSRRVHRWLRSHQGQNRIIHSHERSQDHHITTFHGPPFALVTGMPWWKRMSLRVQINLWLEHREVCARHVLTVVPNSRQIAEMLSKYYPCTGQRLTDAITPGVNKIPCRPPRAVPKHGGIIGFIGKEWKRKGLDLAAEIVLKLGTVRPDLEFLIAGPTPENIRHLFTDWNINYRLLGEVDAAGFYPNIDLLLHPARQEPYGMVVAEAMAAGVPVVLSSNCGVVADVGPSQGIALDTDEDISVWVRGCERMLTTNTRASGTVRRWDDVASDYERLYIRIERAVKS